MWKAVLSVLTLGLVSGSGMGDWEELRVLEQSVTPINYVLAGQGNNWDVHCTGTVVSVEPPVVLTEQHCFRAHADQPHTVQVEGIDFTYEDGPGGLRALFPERAPERWRAIELRQTEPPIGTEVAGLGYVFGQPAMALVVGNVAVTQSAALDTLMNRPQDRPMIYFDLNIWAGMSGGPIVDREGRLVSLVKASRPDVPHSANAISWGTRSVALRDFVAAVLAARR